MLLMVIFNESLFETVTLNVDAVRFSWTLIIDSFSLFRNAEVFDTKLGVVAGILYVDEEEMTLTATSGKTLLTSLLPLLSDV